MSRRTPCVSPPLGPFVFAGGERRLYFILRYVTSLKMDQQNLHLLITAAKIIENGTSESTSWPRLVNNDLLYIVQRRRAALSWLQKRQERIWSTYHDILTYIIHSAAGYGGRFIPAMCKSRCFCVESSLGRIYTTKELHQKVQFWYSVQMRSESQQAFRDMGNSTSFFSALQLSALLSSRRLSTVSMCTLVNIDSTKAETTWGSKEAYIACKAKPE